ncbi:MAG: phospholipid carrier-dependent glycosyltransferase [Candidatus Omnitrophota bacterium]
MKPANNGTKIIILILLSTVFFMLGNGLLSLTNPDEVFYAQTAKEMIQHKTWAVPYLFGAPQFEKPVLTYFLMRAGFLVLGINNFSARFMPALFAMLGVIALYLLGRFAWRDEKKAFFCSLILMSSGFYIGLARTVFTDMIFSVLILFAFASFFWGYSHRERKGPGIILFFIFCGLAVLTKGPLGFLIPAASVIIFLALRRELKFIFCRESAWGVVLFLAVSVPWYAFMIKKFGQSFIQEFFYNDHIRRVLEAEHKGNDTWYFYPFSMVAFMFPWAIFSAASLFFLFKKLKDRASQPIYLYLACWITVVFLAFQPAHSKLTSYILPAFPALALITGGFIYDAIINKSRLIKGLMLASWLIFACFPAVLLISAGKYPEYVTTKGPVYALAIVFSALLLAMLAVILKKKLFAGIYLFMIPVPLVLYFALFSRGYFEAYVSSKAASEYLLKNYEIKNAILCSRSYARGVRYYTDKDTAVINISGRAFFSPHSIPYFGADEPAREFLVKQGTTYCVLKRGSVEDVERIAGAEFEIEKLNKIGDEYIVRVRRVQK